MKTVVLWIAWLMIRTGAVETTSWIFLQYMKLTKLFMAALFSLNNSSYIATLCVISSERSYSTKWLFYLTKTPLPRKYTSYNADVLILNISFMSFHRTGYSRRLRRIHALLKESHLYLERLVQRRVPSGKRSDWAQILRNKLSHALLIKSCVDIEGVRWDRESSNANTANVDCSSAILSPSTRQKLNGSIHDKCSLHEAPSPLL